MKIPKSHPRYTSLKIRDKIVKGVELGITSLHGLTAHGRGEAFDYLLGEKSHDFAKDSIEAAATMLLHARYPVISINGNSAALCAKEFIMLSKLLNAPLEINIFHSSKKREKLLKNYLLKMGATTVLMPEKNISVQYISSNRKYVNKNGIARADVVFVPLEDGDRTQALIKIGKKVITIDLNPLSRTAQAATITIVDHIARAMHLIIGEIIRSKKISKEKLINRLKEYDNKNILANAILAIKRGI